jgi:hypothetical protein
VANRRLDRDEWHFGFPCGKGTEINETYRCGVLGQDFVFRGVKLPKGSFFAHEESPDFISVKLSAETRVHQFELAEGSRLEFPPWFAPPFHLLIFVLLWPLILVRGILSVVRCEVTLIPSHPLLLRVGELEIQVEANDRFACDRRRVLWLLLSSPRKIGEDELSTGFLGFDREGRWRVLTVYQSQPFRGHVIFGSGLVGTQALMFEDGRLARFVLGEDAEIDGKRYARGTRITLDRSGRVRRSKKLAINVPLYTMRPDVDAVARGAKKP